MRPSDARGLQDAGLLVWTGPDLTPWLERAAGSVGAETPQLRLLEVPGTHLRGYGDDHGDDHDDHAHDDHAHDHDHGHDHDGTDPHAWLDPANARLWLEAIAEMLEQTDPGNADLYARNAAAADRRLADLDARIQTELAPYRDDGIVVFHDAYGYFTDHFGLRPAIAVSLGDASTPSAARLSQIRDQIAETGATCAFPEFGGDPKLVQTVIEGTPVRMGNELEPEGGMQEIGPGLYEQTLENMAAVLAGCLGGEQPK
jgi:zinc transport system substrate-binding protein